MTHTPQKRRITRYQELARKAESLVLAIRKASKWEELTVPTIEVERVLNGLRIAFLAIFIFGTVAHAGDTRESVTPPMTTIAGALALGSLGEILATDMKRRKGDTSSARDHRGRAIWMSEAAVGFALCGWWTATYYDHRFGLQTRIEF